MSFLLQDGMTALIWASEMGHVNVVRMLQAAGARHQGHGKKLGVANSSAKVVFINARISANVSVILNISIALFLQV